MMRAPAAATTTAHLLLPLLFLICLFSIAAAEDTRHSISLGNPFNESSPSYFNIRGDAMINNDALQLTKDTSNTNSYFINNSGRIIYNKAFKIWDDRPDSSNSSGSAAGNGTSASLRNVISFNTSFDFNIYPVRNQTVGEGLAFVIVNDGDTIPDNSYGEYLGLTNASTDGDTSNQLVAVEFDTFKQSYDPDANHVGLDINSVRSIVTRSLSDFNMILSPLQTEGVKYRAWIDYSGPLRRIDVYLAYISSPKPSTPLLNATIDLSAHLAQKSYFGFAGSTGTRFELNCVLAWNLTVEILPEESTTSALSWFLKIGVPILAVFLLATVVLGFWLYRRRVVYDERLVGTLRSLPGTPREFKYKELKRATGNFDSRNRLGQGGFGVVYKGVIPGENAAVAVKTFLRATMQGDFLAELTIINRLRHKHLVRLVGWCHKNGKLLLVYDFMPNGSLDQHLFDAPPGEHLPWQRRQRILAGVASALHYLHNEYDQKVVHRDLKASNVLLDAEFNARLGDFGLARAIENERTSYADIEVDGIPGTMGYIAPECFHTGKATRESDVFGFGAVVLEVICGRRPRCDIGRFRFLSEWVWSLHGEGKVLAAVDPRLGEDYDKEEAQRLLLLGLACSHPNASDRPKIQAVLQIISGAIPPPEVPPVRPAFVWPSVCGELYEDSTETTRTCSTAGSSSNQGHYSVHSAQYSETSDFHEVHLR
ncbi:unnamed protein product [Spirodela intermedia]|uniref:non-specific serine/threonine protein kinase n=1 Tax=Spirodela intermedia TaxID=51605 RepID=A0A7I8KLN7_SPIIN|nr:unnamed protein product [Spirodela intermedia]